MNRQIILVGPYPPPYHGTSIPLAHLDQYILDQNLADTVIINTLTRYNLPVYHPQVIGTYLKLTLQLIRSLPKTDLVLITGSQGFISTIGIVFAFITKSVFNKKVSIYVHGGGYDQYYQSRSQFSQRILKRILNKADNLIVQTRQLGDALSTEFSNLAIIPNWTKISDIQNNIIKNDPEAFLTSSDLVRFVFCGELRKEKGIQELLMAFRDIQEKLIDTGRRVSLDLFGQINPAFQELFKSLMIKSGNGNIQYNGYLDHSDLMGKLAEFDVLILPTFLPTEGYPGVIIEAMSVGLPILTTRWRAIPEIVIDGKNGLLSEPKDQAGLLENIIKLTLNDELRSELGANARKEAEKFDAGAVLPVLCNLIGL